jgi:Zn-dependent M16 (insulinase) family peptidase
VTGSTCLVASFVKNVFNNIKKIITICTLQVVGDPKSPLVLRGVVFNEMKGVFADPQTRLHQDLLSHLLPSDTYAHVYGGEPLCIPALTAQDLRNFHSRCYHPSNARIVSYGNFPLDETLRRLQEEQLAGFQRQKVDSTKEGAHLLPTRSFGCGYKS